MLKKLNLTLLRPSMWSGRVLGPLLDWVRAIVRNVLVLTTLILRSVLQIHLLFPILSCILYILTFFFFPHPGGTWHGSPVRTDPFGAALPNFIVICFVFVCLFVCVLFFLHICNFMVTKPNKVYSKKK